MKLRVLSSFFAAALAAAVPATVHSQAAVYAMGSAGHLGGFPVAVTSVTNNNNGLWAYGGTFGIYDNFLKLGPLKLGGDIRGFVQSNGASNIAGVTSASKTSLRGGLIGLRLAGSAPLVPFKPYIQAEIGGASTNFGVNSSNTGGAAYQVQLGADFTVLPHLDARAEYGIGEFLNVGGLATTNSSYTLQQLGAGLVVRF